MRNYLKIILCIALLSWASIQAPHAATTHANSVLPTIHMEINGNRIQTDRAPVNRNGSILVPLRIIFQSLDASVNYDPANKEIIGKRDARTIRLQVGSNIATIDNKQVTVAQAPIVINNLTYVPIRFISESLGASVKWISETQTVQIELPDGPLLTRTELPLINDSGKPITLLSQGNIHLKWYMQDQNPYQQYRGYTGSDHQLIFTNYDDVIRTDLDGNLYSQIPLNNPPFTIFYAYQEKDGFKVVSSPFPDNILVWEHIPLYTESNALLLYENSPMEKWYLAGTSVDREGNLIIPTKDGLAKYNPEGELLWVHKEWKKDSMQVSAFDDLYEIIADPSNRLFICYENHLVVVDPDGNVLAISDGYYSPVILDDGTILDHKSVYEIQNGTLHKLSGTSEVSLQEYRILPDGTGLTLQKLDSQMEKTIWTYSLKKFEVDAGYSFRDDTIVGDKAGNVYISTNGATVHALDANGKLRFQLNVNNGTISKAEVIPLSPKEFVVVENNAVMYFEVE